MNNTMLHMKLNSAVSIFAVAAAFAVFLPPSNALAGICFLPDCEDDGTIYPELPPDPNIDTEKCEKEGYTYYSSGECPKYYAVSSVCRYDDRYLKCDATKWCKENGYNTTTCSLPSFVNDQCPNGKPYYKGCKEDRPRACREQGYVNSCSPGRLYKSTNRCPWDNSYGKCCTASPSTGCPSNYKVTCDPSRGSSGTDTCGYTCYRCCSDACPSGTSQNYHGSYGGRTECGSSCYRCKDCTSGSRSYSGSYVGSSECGSCYACSDTCRSGQKSVSCSSNYIKTRVSTTECGTACYSCQYNSACSATPKSCDYGCASTNSCGICTSCKSKPAEPANPPADKCPGSSQGRYGIWVGNYTCWEVPGCPSSKPFSMVQDVKVYCNATDAFICQRQGYLSVKSGCWATKAECEANYSKTQKFFKGERHSVDSGCCNQCGYF